MSSTLHPLERRVLSSLAKFGREDFQALADDTGLNPDQVRRSIAWLSSKGLVRASEETTTRLEVGRRTPPELVLFKSVSSSLSPPTLESLKSAFESDDEFSAALGRARGLGWISVDKTVTEQVVRVANKEGPRTLESVIEAVRSGQDQSLSEDERGMLTDLLRRGLVVKVQRRETSIEITESGRAASQAIVETPYLERLTPEILASRGWDGKVLRPIDVEAKAPRFYPGRRHPVRDFIKEVRETYISMGFTELEGNSVHPAFWNFDALFIPQDHPGREMQDTFYLEGFTAMEMGRRGVVANVAATHENGWKTGSKGWGYAWRIEEARRLVLRTHNTVLTVRALSESREKETRVFAVSKVYRNENLDYKHLTEFYQMDGIMVGEGLNLRHLMGFLKEFYKKLGMKNVKLWPTYFPYTEPSLEVVGYSDAAKA
ncbi:MAG: phenylalanine--tRNA ligase subunit alpha, partial [Nitrososphaerales archaeon]